jgi:hypothetical protein
MSFYIHNLNEDNEDILLNQNEDSPPCYTADTPAVINFPIVNYTILQNKLNFTLKYPTPGEDEPILPDFYDFYEEDDINSLNNTNVKVYTNYFEISAQFSIQIKKGTTISNNIYFEYTPENISDIQDFIRQTGQNDFTPASGTSTVKLSDFEDKKTCLYTQSFVDRYNENILKYRVHISFIDLIDTDTGKGIYVSEFSSLNRDLLLNLNCNLNYKIVYK